MQEQTRLNSYGSIGTPGNNNIGKPQIFENGANYDSIVVNNRREAAMQDGITLIDSPNVSSDVIKTLPIKSGNSDEKAAKNGR